MKKKAYVKNQVQIIRKTKARFLSIFCIVFLGAAFFAGLRHTSSIMEITMNDYLNKYKYNANPVTINSLIPLLLLKTILSLIPTLFLFAKL